MLLGRTCGLTCSHPRAERTRGQTVVVECSSTSSNSSSSGDKPGKRRKGRAKLPGLFEISVVSPPPRSLGIYALPPLTHNGEMIEVEGSGYVVTSVVIQFKLKGNKYVREHNRLEVLPTGRWLLNQQLESLLQAKYIGPPPGPNTQD